VWNQEFTMRKILTFALVAGSLLVAACNTVEGAGKDVQSVGNAVEDVAK
jgi:predicted small secreted protein